MHYAAQQGDVDVIQQLINRGYTVNCMNYELVTPLHEAATAGHAQACSYLLDEGAWINATNIDGATPLCDAAANGQVECAQLLLSRNASVNPPTLLTSPLHEAAIRGHSKCVSLLIVHGANLDASDCHFGTPLHAACAAYKISMECVTSLIRAGADVNASIIQCTPLHIAARRKNLLLVKLLLMYGADVYAKDSTGRRPSDLALLQRDQNPMVRRVLLDYELNPRSLSEFCRLAVLKSMVIRKDVDYVRNLGLPQKIVHFLLGSLTV